MYYYFSTTGIIKKISNNEVVKLQDDISPQWEDEANEYGRLVLPVFDWAFSESKGVISLDIPNLNGGGSIPENTNASKFFGGEIYGDCFLEANSKGEAKFKTLVTE